MFKTVQPERSRRCVTAVVDYLLQQCQYEFVKMNSDASIETARKVYRLYDGDWEKARRSTTVDADGVLIIRKPKAKRSANRKATTKAV